MLQHPPAQGGFLLLALLTITLMCHINNLYLWGHWLVMAQCEEDVLQGAVSQTMPFMAFAKGRHMLQA